MDGASEPQGEAEQGGATVLDLGHGVQMTVGQDALSAALAAAQGQVRSAEKNARNPHLRNRYAGLESVIQAAREAMTANGLSLTMHPIGRDGWAGVVYVLAHSSGQWRRGELLHSIGQSKGLQPAQADGVCISYARRYVLMSLMQIAAGDDTDGAVETSDRSSGRREQPRERPPAPPRQPAPPPQDRPQGRPDDMEPVDTRSQEWRAFQARLRPIGERGYDALKAWLAERGRVKPSDMTRGQLRALRVYLDTRQANGRTGLEVVGEFAKSDRCRELLGGDA